MLPIWVGFLELGILSGLALFAALALGIRAKWKGRAELAVGAAMLAQAFTVLPIYLLGWMQRLYPSWLAILSFSVSLAALGASFWGRPWRDHLAEVKKAAVSLLRIPVDALALTIRHRSFAFAGLVVSAVSILWTAWLSYLAPSSSWDGLWYHETILSYAIQQHGFAVVDVPETLTYVNSFPRVSEATNLWFVIFTDRRLVEVVNSVSAPLLMLAFYVMARRYTQRLAAMGWASAFFLMPGLILQMRSTYIDTHIASIFLPAILFSTRPVLRIRDAWMAALCIALLGGTKEHALTWMPFLVLIVGVRLLVHHVRTNLAATALAAVGGLLLIAAVVTPPYVRNWFIFENPFYPIDVNLPALHIHWRGSHHLGDWDRPWAQVFRDNFAAHIPGQDFFDTYVHPHGLGFPWIVVPIVVVALPIAILLRLRSLFFRVSKNPEVENLLLVTLPMLATLPLSPAAWALRYNVHVAAVLMLVAAWACGRRGMSLFNEGAVAASIVTGIMMLWWADPAWCITYAQAEELARMSAGERAAYGWKWHTVLAATAQARERELGPGDLALLTDDYAFPAVLWNERYTNRVGYLPFRSAEDFLTQAAAMNAKWVTATAGHPGYNALRGAPNDWEEVGILSTTKPWTAFRRRAH